MQIDMLIRTKRQSVALQISPQGNLIVRAPENCSYEKIQKILEDRAGWIILHQNKIKENRQINSEIIEYNQILFCGFTHKITFADKIKEVGFYQNSCYIPIKYQENKAKQISHIAKTLKIKASEIFKKRMIYFTNLMQLNPNSVMLCNSRRVWGSCDKETNIKLNWRLIMLPPDLIDYVIVHELSHILEFNHSQMFWKIVQSVLPDFKQRRNLLKKGDYLLELFR